MTLSSDIQQLEIDAKVSLITIDATAIGGSTLNFTTVRDNGSNVRFNGVTYRALPSQITGVRQGSNRPAEPILEVADNDAMLLTLIAGREDLTGATVRRTVTLAKYLDGEPTADTSQHFPTEQWRVSGLARREEGVIAWRLTSFIATDGAYIPKRQALRDVCPLSYRQWTGTAWDNSDAECPYRGDQYFDSNDNTVTSEAQDVCSRRLTGCQARFGRLSILPFGGFIGLGRGQE